MYISIAGNIGAGKSTLTEILSAHLCGHTHVGSDLEISARIPEILSRIRQLCPQNFPSVPSCEHLSSDPSDSTQPLNQNCIAPESEADANPHQHPSRKNLLVNADDSCHLIGRNCIAPVGGKENPADLLAHPWQPLFESVEDNPYLDDFYADMPRWAFHLQVHFLNRRFEDLLYIQAHPWLNFIQDRSICEDAEIFARNLHEMGTMRDRDFQNYSRLYHSIKESTQAPLLCIYLRSSVERLLENIARRGRSCERDISPDYIRRLNQLYDQWFEHYNDSPALLIDTAE